PPVNKVPAMTKKPVVKLPVVDFTWPIMVGPNRPPRLATELMRAIPPAAAVPLRKEEGSVQKVGSMLFMPVRVSARPRTKSQGDETRAIVSQPRAARKAEPATCHRRS